MVTHRACGAPLGSAAIANWPGLTVRALQEFERLQRALQLEVAVVEHEVAQNAVLPEKDPASNFGVSAGVCRS